VSKVGTLIIHATGLHLKRLIGACPIGLMCF
jgi:hypothetical protein